MGDTEHLPFLFEARTARRQVLRMSRTEAFANYLVRSGFDYEEFKIDTLVSSQLQRELDDAIMRDYRPAPDGVDDCPLYTKLPAEVRLHIFSFLVVVPESIHLHPVKGNARLGFRLSRCSESLLDLSSGKCNCQRGLMLGQPPAPPPHFLDTELLLLSRTIRRETLDLIFSQNRFTFTSLRDLTHFTEHFGSSASKLQHVRVFERCTDGCHGSWMNRVILDARARIGDLQSLTLHLYLDHFSIYEEPYADGFLTPLLPLYFGHPKTPDSLFIDVTTTRLWNEPTALPPMAVHVKQKLTEVFEGKWHTAEEVPLGEPPKRRVPQSEREPEVKRGLLVLGD